MDRSFLSSPDVIAASRKFVCIRLATYEDAEEAEFLREIFVGRSGALENTVFCLLAPDGKERLSRSGRSPRFAFRSPAEMAQFMAEAAAQYPGRATDSETAPLPRMKNLRLALNVAACDGLPLVVALADDDALQARLADRLATAAFAESLAGRFAFHATGDADQLSELIGRDVQDGIYVVAPGTFGLQATVAKRMAAEISAAALTMELATLADRYDKVDKQHRSHVRAGRREGVDWETEIPVTDAMALRAQQRRGGR